MVFEDIKPEDGNDGSDEFGEVVKIPVGKKLIGLVFRDVRRAKSEFGEFFAYEFEDVTDNGKLITLIGTEETAWGRALNKAMLVDIDTLEVRASVMKRMLTIGKSEAVSKAGRSYHTLIFSIGEAYDGSGDVGDGGDDADDVGAVMDVLRYYKNVGKNIKEAREAAAEELPNVSLDTIKECALKVYF